MKSSSVCQFLTAIIIAVFLLSACERKHEIHKMPFKLISKTWYRISPTAPLPLLVNGTTYTGFAHFPGGGKGNATYLGDCSEYFNQLTYNTSGSPLEPPLGSVAAPVAEVPGYPVIGAPLPLIQAGDFNPLAFAVSSLYIPPSVQNKIVNTVVYNKKGDAIFLSAITGSGATFPISATKVGFNGKALIVTGRGKFRNAIGEVVYNGYFNVVDANDAEYNADGWIAY